jgi:non-ribosomal peptide synthetase component F
MLPFQVIYTSKNNLEDIIHAQEHHQFDLFSVPAWQVALVEHSAEEHSLLFNFHHIISDDLAIEFFLKKLSILYSQYNHKNEFDSLATQYLNWHTISFNLNLEKQADYWRKKLGGAEPVSLLPYWKVKSTDLHTEIRTKDIESNITSSLIALSVENNITLFVLLFALFFKLLNRYSGQDDIVIATTISTRKHENDLNTFGLFLNTLLLRIKMTPEVNNTTLFQTIRDEFFSAHQNSAISYQEVIGQYHREHDHGIDLSGIFFTYREETLASSLELVNIKTKKIITKTSLSKFDLWLDIVKYSDGLKVNFHYRNALFPEDYINNLSEAYDELIRSVFESNCSATETPKAIPALHSSSPRRLDDILRHQAFHIPNKIALITQEVTLTYAALLKRSSALSERIKTLSTKSDTVLIILPRGHELIISIFAILQANKTFIAQPIDQHLNQLQQITDTSNIELIICDINWPYARQLTKVTIIDFPSLENLSPQRNKIPIQKHNDIAHIIFTSGTTGQPKGILMPHASIINRIQWMRDYYNLAKTEERILFKTPITFDVAIGEIFLPLLCGYPIYVAPRHLQTKPIELLN